MSLGALISSFAIDVVGVFTSDFRQVFKDARPIKAMVKPNSKLMEHPIEIGAQIADHRIILQVEIELSMILSRETYRNTYQQIKQLRLDAAVLTVQTKADSYFNQVIQDLPHEEDPDMFDTISVALKLKEIQFVTPQFIVVPRNPANSSTVDRGGQQPQESKSSAAAELLGL